MADIFCDFASGDDADDGSTRALAKKTLQAALTAAGAGGRVGVKNDSAETATADTTFTSPGTAASPTQLLSIDWASDTFGSNALSAGASLNLITNNNLDVLFAGFAYSYGVNYGSGNVGGAANHIQFIASTPSGWVLDTCTLSLRAAAGSQVQIGAVVAATVDDQFVEFINVTVAFTNVGQSIVLQHARFRWHNGTGTAAISGSVPTTLFATNAATHSSEIYGLDLSAASGNLFNINGGGPAEIKVQNCKLHASAVKTTGTVPSQGGVRIWFVNCDSGDTNYKFYSERYEGVVQHDAAIFRDGGASDGTTPISRKMVSSANAKFYVPLVSDPIYLWVETPGSYTATVEVITEGVTLTNAEAWAEVEYPGTSGFPLSLFAHDRATNILTTPANQTSSSVAWTESLTGEVKQKFEVAFTTAEKGPIAVRVYLAKASTTMYFCPKVDVA